MRIIQPYNLPSADRIAGIVAIGRLFNGVYRFRDIEDSVEAAVGSSLELMLSADRSTTEKLPVRQFSVPVVDVHEINGGEELWSILHASLEPFVVSARNNGDDDKCTVL